MSAPLSRADRRQLQRLTHANEPTIQGDVRFFRRRPDRHHRIRLSSAAEVEILQIMRPTAVAAPGFRWFTIVRQVRPGIRMRSFTVWYEDAETDVPEDLAAWVYGQVASPDERLQAFEAKVCKILSEGER